MYNSLVKAPLGITINFCYGLHVIFPPGERLFHLRVSSPINGESVFDGDVQSLAARPVEFNTRQTYYIPWEVEIKYAGKTVFLHRYNPTGREICMDLRSGTLGDMIAWMPAVITFQDYNNCRTTILMRPEYVEMFESVYPKFKFIHESNFNQANYYAIYPIGVWGYGNFDFNPTDFQKDNLIDHGDNILGVNSERKPPQLALATEDCRAKYGRYVCISTRASRKMKQWNCEGAWAKVVDFLKEKGYRVLCIDADNEEMPANAEDFTGMHPLRQRIDLIRGCEFVVGLASGLSWIGWACEKPVVMISGFSEDWVEFPNQYRIIDKSVCFGCFNYGDMRFNEFDLCPNNKDYECTKVITPEKVIEVIKTIPAVKNF